MSKLTLVHGGMDDWFALEGGANWACVEGHSAEWREVVLGIRSNESVHHKRLAFERVADELRFWSPRNSRGEVDVVTHPAAEAEALATHIERVLAAY